MKRAKTAVWPGKSQKNLRMTVSYAIFRKSKRRFGSLALPVRFRSNFEPPSILFGYLITSPIGAAYLLDLKENDLCLPEL